MTTYQALMISGLVICGTGALTAASAFCVAAVCDWIDGAEARRSRARFERRMDRVRARLGLEPRPAVISYRKNGGLHFVKAGRYGAAVWVSRR